MANETATLPRDVNAEFAASKRDQLASALRGLESGRERAERLREQVRTGLESGEMTDLGGGRYRVNVGWDRGEVLRINTAATALTAEEIESSIMGDHGLDTTADGRTALYLKDSPAWHSLGTVIPGGSSSSSRVLHAAGLDWETLQTPSTFTIPDGNGGTVTRALPDSFLNYRSDTLEPLGTVGKIYAPVHNVTAFQFLDDLFGDELMIAESAGSFRGGKRVFISAELPNRLYIDPKGVNDEIRMFVVLLNSHDGSTPFVALVTPWRPVCRNTERLALKNAKHKWTVRHTKSAANRIEEARRTLNLTNAYYGEYVKEETALINTPITSDEIESLISDVWGELDTDATKRSKTIHAARSDKIHELFAEESANVGTNAYAAERAITGYVDHYAALKPRGDLKGNRLAALGQAIMEETRDEPKRVAHAKLMMKVR